MTSLLRDGYSLWVDNDLYRGITQRSETFNNDVLTDREDFVIAIMEVWGFV